MTVDSILEKIKQPNDLSLLDKTEISALAAEIRDRIIQVTSVNGGHVGPNLGVVELSIALHLSFDSPKDKICWDVSHQGYVHKLLTGRNNAKFDNIRNSNGLSGFLNRFESEHDAFGAGHAGTALSAALGMAIARDCQRQDHHVLAVAGDAAFTCGITLEALNNISANTKRLILILNDNEWSIAKNVGALSKYFNELITNPIYTKLHKDAGSVLTRVPFGKQIIKLISKAKRDTKELLGPSSIFEKLGLRYIGPIDGHDIASLTNYLNFAKEADQPIILHVLTKKGKGYPAAQEEPEKWHGSGPFDKNSGKFIPSQKPKASKYQDVFGSSLTSLAKNDEKIVAITAAMPSGTGLSIFEKSIPERFFDVGIAEEHAVVLAAGMAAQGMKPVCAIYSTFLQRAYDPIIHDVCLQELPVTFCLDRAGLSPNDGPTHHGLFDLSYLRCIPNSIIMSPRNENEMQNMLVTAVNSGKPVFIRYPRGTGTGAKILNHPTEIEIGKAETIQSGDSIAIWALGNFVETATAIAKEIETKFAFKPTVVDARFAKPIDEKLLNEHTSNHELIISMEDNVLSGGFGASLLEWKAVNEINIPILRFGWPDKFIDHGDSVKALRKLHGLDDSNIQKEIFDFIYRHQLFKEKSNNLEVVS